MSSAHRYLLAGLLSLCCLRPSAAEYIEPITLAPDATISLRDHVMRLVDRTAALTIDDIRRRDDWQVRRHKPSEGLADAAVWLRFEVIRPRDVNANWRLKIGNPILDDIRLYRQDGSGLWIEDRAAYSIPSSAWPLTSRTPAFAFELPVGRQTLYLRLAARHSLAGSISLQSEDRHVAGATQEAMLFGACFGIFTVLILIQLYMRLLAADELSTWHLPYSLILLLTSLVGSGVARQIFPWTNSWLHEITVLLLGVAPLVFANFSVALLDLKHRAPSVRRIFLWTVAILSVLTTAAVALIGYQIGIAAQQYLLLATALFSTGLGLYLLIGGHRRALFYLLTFSVVDMAIAIAYLRSLGVLPGSFLTEHVLYLALVVHFLAITAIYIHRFNVLKRSLRVEQEARKEQSDFVEMVSHEFRTPLAVINASAEQLSSNLDATPDRRQQRYHNILDATRRMSKLLDEYFSVERFNTANQALHYRTVDPYEILEEAAADFSVERVRLVIQSVPDRFVCDRDLLRVALRNLLANADRHSPADRAVELRVSGGSDDCLRIEVRDQGDGIPADELPRIFQKYFRGRAAKEAPGAGLGLYLVRKIITAHGGRVEVESTPGAGTVFRLSIPNRKLTRP